MAEVYVNGDTDFTEPIAGLKSNVATAAEEFDLKDNEHINTLEKVNMSVEYDTSNKEECSDLLNDSGINGSYDMNENSEHYNSSEQDELSTSANKTEIKNDDSTSNLNDNTLCKIDSETPHVDTSSEKNISISNDESNELNDETVEKNDFLIATGSENVNSNEESVESMVSLTESNESESEEGSVNSFDDGSLTESYVKVSLDAAENSDEDTQETLNNSSTEPPFTLDKTAIELDDEYDEETPLKKDVLEESEITIETVSEVAANPVEETKYSSNIPKIEISSHNVDDVDDQSLIPETKLDQTVYVKEVVSEVVDDTPVAANHSVDSSVAEIKDSETVSLKNESVSDVVVESKSVPINTFSTPIVIDSDSDSAKIIDKTVSTPVTMTDDSNDTKAAESIDDSNYNPIGTLNESVSAPVDITVDTPKEEPVESPPVITTPVDTPKEEPVESPPVITTPVDTPKEEPVESPPVVTTPVDTLKEEPVESPPVVTTPVDTPKEEPVESPPVVTTSVDTLKEEPVESPPVVTTPVDTLKEEPVESPPVVTTPVDTPKEEPVESPSAVTTPVDTPKEEPVESPSVTEKDKTAEDDGPDIGEELDILGNGLLKKKIILKGKGVSTRPLPGNLVTVRCEGRLASGKVVDKHEKLKFVLSDEDVIQAFDLAVALMEDQEVATVYTDGRYAYGIHGRPEFTPPIPANASITYEIEILSIEDGPNLETISNEERIIYGDKKRMRGNDLYGKGEFSASINSYKRGIKYLDGTDDEDVMNMKIKCLNNLSAGQLQVKAYKMAIQSLDTVLQFEPENVKALFRKGKCLEGLKKEEEALEYIKKASMLDPQNKSIMQELGRLRSRVAVTHEKEKKIYQKMFQSKKEEKISKEEEDLNWSVNIASAVVGVLGMVAGLLWYKHR